MPGSAALAALSFFLIGAKGCGPEEAAYLMQQAPGQLMLLIKRVPFEKVLEDPGLDPAVRAKLEFVLEVKNWGVNELGLIKNKNYEILVEVDRPALSWNLTAAEPFSLQPLTWVFPVAGQMPYLGFFKKEHALKKAEKLERKGYETYLRTADAYSMLGIIADPLYSPLLDYREANLANLILHEMTHGTVFVKGEMEFNENLALFVGNQGAYLFLSQKYGPDSDEAVYVKWRNHDDAVFSKELMALHHELSELYASGLSDEEKLAKKAEIFARHKRRFKHEVLPKMKTDRYRRWPRMDLNNATVISRAVYYHDLSLYEDLYAALGNNLKAVLDFFKRPENQQGDPEERARERLAGAGGA